jgi:probable selenium-dependent hydroxylase accessory protein YqeC
MRLHEMLKLPILNRTVVSICGAGGKTTLMHLLAREAMHRGRRAAMMTTTHIWKPEGEGMVVLEDFSPDGVLEIWRQGKIVVAGHSLEAERRFGPPLETETSWLLENAEAVYVEADGSRCLPLKYPAAWEPVIPAGTTSVVVVAGLSALGRPVDLVCHRAALAREALGFGEEFVSEALMARLLWEGYGKFDPIYLLNQSDLPGARDRGAAVAAGLRALGAGHAAVASLQDYLTGEFAV